MRNSINLQGSSLRGAPPHKDNSAILRKLGAALKFVLVLVASGGILNVYIYLNQRIGDTERNIRRIKAETLEVEREIEQRRLELAGLTTRSYIQRKIAEYRLNLRPAQYAQTRRLVMRAAPDTPAAQPVRIGSR